MESVTVRECLVELLGWEYVRDGEADLIPTELLVLDWKRAAEHVAGRRKKNGPVISRDKLQKILVRDIGFDTDRVLRITDPAVRPIVRRMLALPMLTDQICSGHVNKRGGIKRGQNWTYFGIVFRDPAFGKKFCEGFKQVFGDGPYFTCVCGSSSAHYGVVDHELPVDLCVKLSLPVYFYMCASPGGGVEELTDIWKHVSCLLDHFDHGGPFTIEPELFRESIPCIVGRKVERFSDVLCDLFPDQKFETTSEA